MYRTFSKIKYFLILWNLWLQKKRTKIILFPLHLFSCCIRDPGWKKIRIRDKHHGSATMLLADKRFHYLYLVSSKHYHGHRNSKITLLIWKKLIEQIDAKSGSNRRKLQNMNRDETVPWQQACWCAGPVRNSFPPLETPSLLSPYHSPLHNRHS